MLRRFADDIWIGDGPPVTAFGPLKFPTRTIVVRLGDGSLWVNSPIGDPEADLEALGAVRYLVAPTRLHVWRLERWRTAYPAAELWGPPRTPRRFQGIEFAGNLGDEGSPWERDIDQVVFRGNALIDEVEFLHRKSGTAIFADFIQNYPSQPGRVIGNALMRVAGVLDGGVPRDIRLSMTRRDLARASLDRILAWEFDRLILAHGRCLERDAKEFVRDAFRWLRR